MKNRMFRGKPTDKLIIRIERDTIEAIDNATRHRPGLPAGNRSEFIRQAIEARLSQGRKTESFLGQFMDKTDSDASGY